MNIKTNPSPFIQFNKMITPSPIRTKNEQRELVQRFCKTFKLPDSSRNHADFDEQLVQKIASFKDESIQAITDMLKYTTDEKDITAGLFLLNRIIDAGTKNVGDSYHILSKFNYNKSPNIQVMLAGIYRKTLVPDGFGPLMATLIQNSQNPPSGYFDPNEEVGGAILEYLRNSSAIEKYTNLQNK